MLSRVRDKKEWGLQQGILKVKEGHFILLSL